MWQIGLLAGIFSGLLLSICARIVMRILAIMGNRPLEFTLRGTFEIFLTVTILNVLGAFLFLGVRQFLPGDGVVKGIAYGGALLFTLGVLFFLAENAFGELDIAGPVPSIALFGMLFVLYGYVIEGSVRLLEKSLVQ